MKIQRSSLEPLEARIVPAGFTFTFTDVDGDLATLTVSRGTQADVVITLSVPSGPFNGQQLELVRVTDTVPQGANVSLTAKRQDADGDGTLDGDGRVNLGRFVAGYGVGLIGGRDLGVLNFSGDVGHVRIGDSEGSDNGLSFKSLTVGSLGLLGTSTGAPDLVSEIYGQAGTLKILGDLAAGTSLGGLEGGLPVFLSSVAIGGSVAGTLAVSAGKAVIGGDVTGRIEGGRFGQLTIEGSLLGGVANESGVIKNIHADSLRIAGDVRGGSGVSSGGILNDGNHGYVGAISVGGSVTGGTGDHSGSILVRYEIASLTIGGDLQGGTGLGSGRVASRSDFDPAPDLEIGALTVGGSLIGGPAERSGAVEALGLKQSALGSATQGGVVKIGGDVVGGSATDSGRLFFAYGRSITIGGSVVGGGGIKSGQLDLFAGDLERLVIGGDVRGGASGLIIIGPDAREFVVGGSLLGGFVSLGVVGKLSIGGDLDGNVFSATAITAGTIGGSLIGGSISVENQIGSLAIAGSMRDGAALGASGLSLLGNASDLAIGRLTIGGSVEDAFVAADRRDIGAVIVGGDWVASSLSVGVAAGGDMVFGTSDDTSSDPNPARVSRLGSLTIKGMALGTPASDDTAIFAISAREIGAISVAGKAEPMQPGPGNDLFALRNPLGATFHSDGSGDLRVFEIPFAGATPAPVPLPPAPRPAAGADFTYTDVDGDLVSVVVTKGTPLFVTTPRGPFAEGQQLTAIDFQLDPTAAGASITVTAQRQDANGDGFLDGDGLANVGEIKAFAVPLGTVTIRGDLGAIEAGGASAAGIKKLAVLSLGRFGTTTGAADTVSGVVGALGSVAIGSDLAGTLRAESLGTVKIGGALTGTLEATNGALGKLTVAGDLRGVVQGATIGAVTIGGSVFGDAAGGGKISATSRFTGAVKIGGDFRGEFADAARIYSGGDLPALTIGGAIHGFAADAATIEVLGKTGGLSVARDVVGTAQNAASISAAGKIASLAIGGSLTGSAAPSASISGGSFGAVTIAGDMRGSSFGAVIQSTGGAISKLTIGGSLLAEPAATSGAQILAQGDLGAVKIGRDIRGGGSDSGYLAAEGNFASLTLGGSLVGGAGSRSGAIIVAGDLSSAKIGLNVTGGILRDGGAGFNRSGYIEAQHIGTIALGGSLIAGADESSSSDIARAGSIRAVDDITALTIGGNLTGTFRMVGGVEQITPAVISARGQASASGSSDVAIGRFSIGGNINNAMIYAGYSPTLVALNADAQIGTVTVSGHWIASSLIAGISANGDGFGNGNDSKITGAGVKDLDDSTGAVSRIASLIIKGSALGTPAANDTAVFGIEAQHLVSISLGGIKEPMQTGRGNDLFNLRNPLGSTLATDATGDLRAFEV